MIIAERVRKSYDAYALNYDAGTGLQRGLADKIVNALRDDRVKFSHVLDVGCGTGYLTDKLKATGCDISFGMLSCAKNKSNSRYVQSNAAILPFAGSIFDLVVSNAAYQWVPNLAAAFKEVKRVLKPKGKFYFVAFNKNTLCELQSACSQINVASSNFPDKAKLVSSLNKAGFKAAAIETFNHKKYYKDLWELLAVLKNIGSTAAENRNINGLGWRRILRRANESYLEKFGSEKGLPATYEAYLVKAENV